MNKEETRQAFKGSADAVRRYLESIGMRLTHTQALEVVARGGGLRSRHLLAQALDALSGPQHAAQARPVSPAAGQSGHPAQTRVTYRYVDGSNSKRFSSITFRGRITPEQLRFIVHKLDEGLYFVPAQVGFESLHFAFTDDGGDDHCWHTLEVGEPDTWVLDADGFVQSAGDIEQVPATLDGATDADCDNLVWRFARVLAWDESLQEAALSRHAYRRPEPASRDDGTDTKLAARWQQALSLAPDLTELLRKLAYGLLEQGFAPVDGLALEMRREMGPNAYQFCLLEAPSSEHNAFQVNFDVSTNSGAYLTHTPLMGLPKDATQEALYALLRQLQDQARSVRSLPAAYDSAFE